VAAGFNLVSSGTFKRCLEQRDWRSSMACKALNAKNLKKQGEIGQS
jgi:hypothetical protein